MVVHCAAKILAQFFQVGEAPTIAACTGPPRLRSSQGRGFSTWTSARLDDEDILPSHTLLDLDPGLTDLELAEEDLCGRDTEVVADGSCPR